MIRYRIKTKQEFIDEFGEDCFNSRISIIRGGWNRDMDYLFGVEIPYNINELNQFGFFLIKNINIESSIYNWSISHDMIKQIGINYNDKKVLVYD